LTCGCKNGKKIGLSTCFEREKNVLEELTDLGSPHVPRILFYNDVTYHSVRKLIIRERKISNTLQNVHSRGIVHRDLRKFNFLRNLDDLNENILIIDWGYSTMILKRLNLQCIGIYARQSSAINDR
jgi:RIO-like serine/threonine protein kinase